MRLHYNAQDDLHSQGQHLTILRLDQGWGNNLWATRCSEHAGPRVSNKFVKWLPVRPKPNSRQKKPCHSKMGFWTTVCSAGIRTNIGCLLSLVLSRRNNNNIYLETSTSRPLRKLVCDKFFGDRSNKGFPAPPGDEPTTSLHHKMDRPNRGRPSRGRII